MNCVDAVAQSAMQVLGPIALLQMLHSVLEDISETSTSSLRSVGNGTAHEQDRVDLSLEMDVVQNCLPGTR